MCGWLVRWVRASLLERTLVLLFLRYPFEQWVVQAVASVTIAHFNSVGNAAGRKLVDDRDCPEALDG